MHPDLNLDIVQTINLTPNVNTGNSNPREIVFCTKIDANKVLRAQFGDLVVSHISNNTKDTATRGELGIVVGRDFTDSGTIKFWSLHNQRVVARQKFSIIPITDAIVAIINKLSSKEQVLLPSLDPIYQLDNDFNVLYHDNLQEPELILSKEDMNRKTVVPNITRVEKQQHMQHLI